jgi:DNA repair exonuclease SbcCD ATPase subunit
MRPQFGESFLKLTSAAKLSLFSDILELNLWLEKSKLAAELADEIYQSVVDLAQELEVCRSQIEILAEDITKIEPQAQAFEKTRKDQIKSKRNEIGDAEDRISHIDAALTKLRQTCKDHDASLSEDDKTMDEYADKLAKLNTALGRLDSELQAANSDISNARQKLIELPAAGATCPRCRQKLDPSHLKTETKHWNTLISTCQTNAFEISANIDVKRQRQKEIFRVIGHMKAAKLEVMDKRAATTAAISNSERDKAMLSQAIEISSKQIAGLKVAENPHTEFLEEKRKAWHKFRKDEVRLIEQLKEAQEEHASVHPWIAGFKKIRLFIIEQTLKALEIEINNNLASLGMPDWTINLDVERENKSGGVTKGFSVFVHAPDHKEPVRFESWCGGETQRLCTAADIGLSNLIMERAGLENQIEFYDEVTTHLSAEGMQDLVETLAHRAETENKRIFIVDHNVFDYGGFAGVITIVKNKSGSEIHNGSR